MSVSVDSKTLPKDYRAGTCICLVGMAPDTGNLGVSALCGSVLHGISARIKDAEIVVWDHSPGITSLDWKLGNKDVAALRCGAYHTKRLYRTESLWNIRACSWFGGLWNQGAQKVIASKAFLDISGGDSFTDMYGPWRFRAVTQPKLIALEQRKPLILLPQTYGPFRDPQNRSAARRIVCASTLAWARDNRSFEVLKELLGDAFDPNRHRVGVDVAFGLPVVRPAQNVLSILEPWFDKRPVPIVGLNVSGLLMNRPQDAKEQYGLKADYGDAIFKLVSRFLNESTARIILVPHVISEPGHYESDIDACNIIVKRLGGGYNDRIMVAPVVNDPCEVKWIIAQCDWFCGTRMHSTIAALSSGVPTAAISYSPKTLGVFETCGQGDHVADPCNLDTGEVVDYLWRSWEARGKAQESLHQALPDVLRLAELQMDDIAARIGYPMLNLPHDERAAQ